MASQDVEKGKKVSRGYVPWDDDMDKVLLDTFVEHYQKGDRYQNGWKPHVYTAAIKNVHEKCGVNIAKSNIESRSKTFDKHYNIINGMLSPVDLAGMGRETSLKLIAILYGSHMLRETRMLKVTGTRSSSIGTPSVWFTARTSQLERELELHLRAQRRCLKKMGATKIKLDPLQPQAV